MMYLIQHQAWWLVFAMVFAGLAGWAWYGMRMRPRLEAAARERDRLMKELVNIGVELNGGAGISPELERELDTARRRADLSAAHAAEMERALEAARSRTEEATSRIAELERQLERADFDGEDYRRLRDEDTERQRLTLDVESTPAPVEPPPPPAPPPGPEDMAQAWRLRYFEQRVRYLENNNHKPAPASASVEAQRLDWRARVAEAKVRHLEQELRGAKPVTLTAPQSLAEPAGEDPLLHWRRLYLEKRLAHMRDQAPLAQAAASMPPSAPDQEAEIAKWRARYLESRLRSAEARLAGVANAPTPAAPQPLLEESALDDREFAAEEETVEEAPPPPPPTGSEQRPQSLPAARNGAPDDFSLIEGVSAIQQNSLYALGIYHYEQVAAWTPANIAWVDQYFRLRGRITEEDWVGQAAALAREGPAAARRATEDLDA